MVHPRSASPLPFKQSLHPFLDPLTAAGFLFTSARDGHSSAAGMAEENGRGYSPQQLRQMHGINKQQTRLPLEGFRCLPRNHLACFCHLPRSLATASLLASFLEQLLHRTWLLQPFQRVRPYLHFNKDFTWNTGSGFCFPS